jgi:hypothetical protein
MNRPLQNPEAESLAIALAKAFDGVERRRLSNEFLKKHPDLKRWEGLAITDRANFLKKQFDNLAKSE